MYVHVQDCTQNLIIYCYWQKMNLLSSYLQSTLLKNKNETEGIHSQLPLIFSKAEIVLHVHTVDQTPGLYK